MLKYKVIATQALEYEVEAEDEEEAIRIAIERFTDSYDADLINLFDGKLSNFFNWRAKEVKDG